MEKNTGFLAAAMSAMAALGEGESLTLSAPREPSRIGMRGGKHECSKNHTGQRKLRREAKRLRNKARRGQ